MDKDEILEAVGENFDDRHPIERLWQVPQESIGDGFQMALGAMQYLVAVHDVPWTYEPPASFWANLAGFLDAVVVLLPEFDEAEPIDLVEDERVYVPVPEKKPPRG